MKFQGFDEASQNWFKTPHQMIDLSAQMTGAEMKVVFYILRHTWGFHQNKRRITLDEFENGRKRKDGTRMDRGTGLSRPSVLRGIKSAIERGCLIVQKEGNDLARIKHYYTVRLSDRGTERKRQGENDVTEGVTKNNRGGNETLPRSEKETTRKKLLKKTGEPEGSHARKDGFSFGEEASSKRNGPILTDRDVDHAKRLRDILIKNTKEQKQAKQPIGLKPLATCMYRLRKKKISDERIEAAISFLQETYGETYTPKLWRKDDFFEKFDRIEAARVRYYSGEGSEKNDEDDYDSWKRRNSLILKVRKAMGDDFDFDQRAPQELVDKALVKLGMAPGSVKTGEVL